MTKKKTITPETFCILMCSEYSDYVRDLFELCGLEYMMSDEFKMSFENEIKFMKNDIEKTFCYCEKIICSKCGTVEKYIEDKDYVDEENFDLVQDIEFVYED